MDGFLSTNTQIRRNACYILINLESNHWHRYWESCCYGYSPACLITYNIHYRIFYMIKKYPGLSDLLDGFAMLTKMSLGKDITVNQLLREKTIEFMQSYLNKIYLKTNLTTKHIDIIFYASLFLTNISNQHGVTHTKEIINIGIKMFKTIELRLVINPQNEDLLKISHNILKWMGNILFYHHYLEQYFMQLLQSNQATLLLSLLKFINNKCAKNRKAVLYFIAVMVNEFYILRHPDANRDFKSNVTMLIHCDLFKYIKHLSIEINNQLFKDFEIYNHELKSLLCILYGTIKYGDSFQAQLLLGDEIIITLISNALTSTIRGHHTRALSIIHRIFSSGDYSIIHKLLYPNDGCIISGICALINNYQAIHFNMYRESKKQFLELFQYLASIHDEIESDYIKTKLKENDLLNSLINNEFIDKDKVVNKHLLKTMINNDELVNKFAVEILCVSDLCV